MEILDLVDCNDNTIGKHSRDWFYQTKNHNYRVVNIFVTNKDGNILIQKRNKNCKYFPNSYDFSAGGHVLTGESYEQAAYRELYEETGYEKSQHRLFEIGYFPYPNEYNTSSFSKLYYLSTKDDTPIISQETQACSFLPENEIRKLLLIERFKSDYQPLFEYFCQWRKAYEK